MERADAEHQAELVLARRAEDAALAAPNHRSGGIRHDSAVAIRTIALDAARQEIVEACNEPVVDPKVADRRCAAWTSAP